MKWRWFSSETVNSNWLYQRALPSHARSAVVKPRTDHLLSPAMTQLGLAKLCWTWQCRGVNVEPMKSLLLPPIQAALSDKDESVPTISLPDQECGSLAVQVTPIEDAKAQRALLDRLFSTLSSDSKTNTNDLMSLLQCAQSQQLSVSVRSVHVLMQRLLRDEQNERVIELFKQLSSFGIIPDATTYHTVMMALYQCNDTARMHRFHSKMIQQNILPSPHQYSILLRHEGRLAKKAKQENNLKEWREAMTRAWKWMEEAKAMNLLDLYHYSRAIRLAAENDYIEMALKLYNEASLQFQHPMPYAVYFWTLDAMTRKSEFYNEALHLIQEMEHKGNHAPCHLARRSLLHAAAAQGDLERGMTLFCFALKEKQERDPLIYEQILYCLCNASKSIESEKIQSRFKGMKKPLAGDAPHSLSASDQLVANENDAHEKEYVQPEDLDFEYDSSELQTRTRFVAKKEIQPEKIIPLPVAEKKFYEWDEFQFYLPEKEDEILRLSEALFKTFQKNCPRLNESVPSWQKWTSRVYSAQLAIYTTRLLTDKARSFFNELPIHHAHDYELMLQAYEAVLDVKSILALDEKLRKSGPLFTFSLLRRWTASLTRCGELSAAMHVVTQIWCKQAPRIPPPRRIHVKSLVHRLWYAQRHTELAQLDACTVSNMADAVVPSSHGDFHSAAPVRRHLQGAGSIQELKELSLAAPLVPNAWRQRNQAVNTLLDRVYGPTCRTGERRPRPMKKLALDAHLKERRERVWQSDEQRVSGKSRKRLRIQTFIKRLRGPRKSQKD